MPKVTTQKARKDYPREGIKKGNIYYKWSIKTGPASGIDYRSATPPKPSQLTGSPFMQEYYSIQEQIENLTGETSEDLKSQMEEIVGSIESLRDETQGSLDNMPEGLRQGNTGQLLQERIDGLEAWVSDLESVNLEFDFDEEEPEDTPDEPAQEKDESDDDYEARHDEWETEVNEAETEMEEWIGRKNEAEADFVSIQIEEIQGYDAGL